MRYRGLVSGVILIILTTVLFTELPYSDRTLLQMLLPVIRLGGVVLHLSTIVGIALLCVGGYLIVNSHVIKHKSLVFLMIILILPLLIRSTDYLKRMVYVASEGVAAVEIIDSDICISSDLGEFIVELEIEMISHRDYEGEVLLDIDLPSSINRKMLTVIGPVEKFNGLRKNKVYHVSYSEVLMLDEHSDSLQRATYQFEDYKLILRDEIREVVVIRNDSI